MAVPVHPKPIVGDGRVFGKDGGEPALGRMTSLIINSQANGKAS